MGQTESVGPHKTAESFSQLVTDVAEANRIASNYTDSAGRKLVYWLDPQDEDVIPLPVFWKHFVTIIVKKLPATGSKQPKKHLNIKQFYRMFHYMKELTATPDGTPRPNVYPKTSTSKGEDSDEDDDNECVICMERKARVVMDCTHAFCDVCLAKWNEKSMTCPLCRMAKQQPANSTPNLRRNKAKASTSSNSDWWIIDEGEDISNYFDEFLAQLTEND
eukprot:TRINITY_DN2716_c0_g1_i4.p1 TRINITY_DN2716_c0_g1~~TRINITY_DN2716_c0_g1_i4.p1  ORF type:complete len:219 (+),score=33.40 TRINITY_DN2716_c0_g1_i4:51-707(+)